VHIFKTFPNSNEPKLISKFSPILFVGTFFLAVFVIMAESPNPEQVEVIKYTTVTGYFLQDEPSTDPNGFDYVS